MSKHQVENILNEYIAENPFQIFKDLDRFITVKFCTGRTKCILYVYNGQD